MKIIRERLRTALMLLFFHIYLQWTSITELLAKKESGSWLRDPLLLGSASKMFCHGINSQTHDRITILFVSLLGIDPMRIYMCQSFAEEVIQNSVNVRLFMGATDDSTSRT
jgi:hypothetical protein